MNKVQIINDEMLIPVHEACKFVIENCNKKEREPQPCKGNYEKSENQNFSNENYLSKHFRMPKYKLIKCRYMYHVKTSFVADSYCNMQ